MLICSSICSYMPYAAVTGFLRIARAPKSPLTNFVSYMGYLHGMHREYCQHRPLKSAQQTKGRALTSGDISPLRNTSNTTASPNIECTHVVFGCCEICLPQLKSPYPHTLLLLPTSLGPADRLLARSTASARAMSSARYLSSVSSSSSPASRTRKVVSPCFESDRENVQWPRLGVHAGVTS